MVLKTSWKDKRDTNLKNIIKEKLSWFWLDCTKSALLAKEDWIGGDDTIGKSSRL